jgi:hypothetical protein
MGEDGKKGGGWADAALGMGRDVLGLATGKHSITEIVEGSEGPAEIAESAEKMAKKFEGFEGMGLDLSRIEQLAKGAEPTFAETVEQAQYGVTNADKLGGVGRASQYLGPAALLSGVIEGRSSLKEMDEHGVNLENAPKLLEAGLDTTAGGIGTAGLAGTLMTKFAGTELAQTLGLGGTVDAGVGMSGVAGAGVEASAGAGAVAELGEFAGAAAGGMALGDWMGKTADSDATRTGVWGKDNSGKNKSAMDWGAGWGTWVDTHTGDKNAANPSLLGGLAAVEGGMLGGILGTVQAHPLLTTEPMLAF